MDNLLEQLEQWNKNDEFSRCIEAICCTRRAMRILS